jgi:hypothetical protein
VVIFIACGNPDPESGPGQEPPIGITPEGTATPEPPYIPGTVTPAIPSTPVPTPTFDLSTPDPSEPYHVAITSSLVAVEPLPLNYFETDQLFVTGRVVELLPARWTTPDGSRPVNPREVVPDVVTIVTPIVLELDGPPVVSLVPVDLSSGRIVILIHGGHVGGDSVTEDVYWHQYTVGERVFVALTAKQIGNKPGGLVPTEAGPGWWIGGKWTLTDDGQAVSYWGSQPAAALIAAFQEAAQRLPVDPTPVVLTPTSLPSP